MTLMTYKKLNPNQTLSLSLCLSLSLFHLNACSLNKNFDDLQFDDLIKTTNQTFDVIAMSPESKVIIIWILQLTLICQLFP